MQADRIRQMESDITRIHGVQSARLQAENGEISEVHVIADPSRRPKWIVRDVVTTLFARYGVRVPYQRISIAGSAPLAVAGTAAGPEGYRPRLASVQLAREGERVRATVELHDGEQSSRGSCELPAIRSNETRAIAEATVEAVRRITDGELSVHLQEIRRFHLGELPIVLAHLIWLRPVGERSLVGTCSLRRGALEAAAGAVLDAVNRVLGPYRGSIGEIEYDVEENPEA